MVTGGSFPSLVRSVLVHGMVSVDVIRVQVDLLSRIRSVNATCRKLRCDAGALAALRACRDAFFPDVVIKPLNALIVALGV